MRARSDERNRAGSEPLLAFVGVLAFGMATRPLGGVAPMLEIFAHGSCRQTDSALLEDRVAYGAARPQRRRNPQLLGTVAVDEVLEVMGMLAIEETVGAEWASAFAYLASSVPILRRAAHCSGVYSTSRALLPLYAPTMPSSAMKSINRAALP
jgi:hypothetical protein